MLPAFSSKNSACRWKTFVRVEGPFSVCLHDGSVLVLDKSRMLEKNITMKRIMEDQPDNDYHLARR
jgi:hypothetical protein